MPKLIIGGLYSHQSHSQGREPCFRWEKVVLCFQNTHKIVILPFWNCSNWLNTYFSKIIKKMEYDIRKSIFEQKAKTDTRGPYSHLNHGQGREPCFRWEKVVVCFQNTHKTVILTFWNYSNWLNAYFSKIKKKWNVTSESRFLSKNQNWS